mmetsp:Transcript_4532/g.13062  ORF Transcript_4532/g.13062 Transcript_4532/m.13062 type:complete len:218 (-) Transcript_4532:834-1487(-)
MKCPASSTVSCWDLGSSLVSRLASSLDLSKLSSDPTTTSDGISSCFNRDSTKTEDPTINQFLMRCSRRSGGRNSEVISNISRKPWMVSVMREPSRMLSMFRKVSSILWYCCRLGITADRVSPPTTEYNEGIWKGPTRVGSGLWVSFPSVVRMGATTSQDDASKDVAGLTRTIPLIGWVVVVMVVSLSLSVSSFLSARLRTCSATAEVSMPPKDSPMR